MAFISPSQNLHQSAQKRTTTGLPAQAAGKCAGMPSRRTVWKVGAMSPMLSLAGGSPPQAASAKVRARRNARIDNRTVNHCRRRAFGIRGW